VSGEGVASFTKKKKRAKGICAWKKYEMLGAGGLHLYLYFFYLSIGHIFFMNIV